MHTSERSDAVVQVATPDLVPDVLGPGLRVVFCGSALGDVSWRRHAYYANPGNRFWQTLAEVGLTPRRLEPREYARLPEWGIGLTDLVKSDHGRMLAFSTDTWTSRPHARC